MSSQPPYALLRAEIKHLKEINADLLEAAELAAAMLRDGGTFPIEGQTYLRLRAAIAKAKAI